MKTILYGLLAVLFLFVQLAGSAFAQVTPDDTPSPNAIQTSENAPGDEEIKKRLSEIFAEIEGLETIQLNVTAGVVTLAGEVTAPNLSTEAEALASRVDGVVAVQNDIQDVLEVSRRVLPVLERFQQRILQGFNYLPLLTIAVAAFFIIAALGWWIAALSWPWSRLAPNAFVADLLRQVVRLSFTALALVVSLDFLGATAALGTIAGAAGIAGLALGFAVRDTVENYIASILLSLRQPFRPNDHVLIDGQEGRVVRLTSRATVILSMEGNHIRIPNATVFKGVIVNYSRNPERRFEFVLGVDANSDLNQVRKVGLSTLQTLKFVLKRPAPDSVVQDVGDFAVLIWFSGWIDQRYADYNRARGEAIHQVKSALEQTGITLPGPRYKIQLERQGNNTRFPSEAKQEHSPPSSVLGLESDTTAHDPVKDMVSQERIKDADNQDLLSERAPTELG